MLFYAGNIKSVQINTCKGIYFRIIFETFGKKLY